jgi:hypothetical protein
VEVFLLIFYFWVIFLYKLLIFLENGELFSCGRNSYGQLGLNDSTNRNTFHRVAFNKRIIQISSGFGHILVLTGLYFLSVPVLIFCF